MPVAQITRTEFRKDPTSLSRAIDSIINQINAAQLLESRIDGTPADHELHVYDTTDSVWKNHTAAEAGLAAAAHTHDDRYYTETELDAGQLDNRYYTETELDTALALKAPLASPTFTGAVTIPQTADDGTYTGIVTNDSGVLKYRTTAEILSDIGAAASAHTHDDRYFTETESDARFSPIAGSASIVTVGTIGTGTWQGSVIGAAYLDANVILASELAAWAGSTNVTTLGTIGTGVWQGTVIDSSYIDQSLSVASLTASGTVQAEHLYTTDDLVVDGSVGIGTASPQVALHLNSAGHAVMRISSASGYDAGIQFSNAPTEADFYIGHESGANVLALGAGGTFGSNLGMSLDASGNVTFGAIVDIPEYLRHAGDTNTYLRFGPSADEIWLVAGGDGAIHGSGSVLDLVPYAQHNAKFFALASSGQNPLLDIYGYKTGVGVKYGRHFVYSDGSYRMQSQETMYVNPAYNLVLLTGAGYNIYNRFGGTQYWQDRDDSNADRMTLDSASGLLTLYGKMVQNDVHGVTTTRLETLEFNITCTGTADVGFGQQIQWNLENDGGSLHEAARLTVEWEDPSAASEASKFTFVTYTGGSVNEAVRFTHDGSIECDADSGLGAATVGKFDEYDDVALIRNLSDRAVQKHWWRDNAALYQQLGVLSPKSIGNGYMINIPTTLQLFAGGIYQTADRVTRLEARMAQLEAIVTAS